MNVYKVFMMMGHGSINTWINKIYKSNYLYKCFNLTQKQQKIISKFQIVNGEHELISQSVCSVHVCVYIFDNLAIINFFSD